MHSTDLRFSNGYSIDARVLLRTFRTSECKAVLAAISNHKAKHKVSGAISALRQTRNSFKTRTNYHKSSLGLAEDFVDTFWASSDCILPVVILELGQNPAGSESRCVTLVEWGRHR